MIKCLERDERIRARVIINRIGNGKWDDNGEACQIKSSNLALKLRLENGGMEAVADSRRFPFQRV